MKKINTIILGVICLCFGFFLPVNAQLRYGVKAGPSLTTVHFNKGKIDPEVAIGYQVGPTTEWMFSSPLNLGMDLSVLFSQSGIEYHNKRYTHNYIDIPLNLKWKVGFPVGKLFFFAGPYYAICLGDKQWKIPVSSSDGGYTMTVTAEKKDIGVNIGAGFEFLSHFQAGVNYRYGIGDAYVVSTGSKSYAQNRGWQLSVSYLF